MPSLSKTRETFLLVILSLSLLIVFSGDINQVHAVDMTLDGTTGYSGLGTGTFSCGQSFNFGSINIGIGDIVFILSGANNTNAKITSFNQNTFTFINRANITANGMIFWEYYAVSTVSVTGWKGWTTINSPSNTRLVCGTFAVANSLGVFDPNLSSPVSNSGTSSTSPNVPITTTYPNDLIFAYYTAYPGGINFPGVQTGFSSLQWCNHTDDVFTCGEYKIFTSTQQATSITFPQTSTKWLMIADAFKGPVQAPTVTNVLPNIAGPGTIVSVSGTDFISLVSVTYRGSPVTYSVASDTKMNVTAPNVSNGVGDIVVTNTAGASTVNLGDRLWVWTVPIPANYVDSEPGANFSSTGGNAVQTTEAFYNSITESSPIQFDITGLESIQHNRRTDFSVNTTGAFSLLFVYGPPAYPIVVHCSCSTSYQPSALLLQYSSGLLNDALNIIWLAAPPFTEPQSVLFKDDFLYQTNYLSNQWTVEQFEALTEPAGVYTQSGFLVYSQPSSPGVFAPPVGVNVRLAAVHVTNPAWSRGMDNTTLYKRKLTVSLIPYNKNPSLGVLNVGFGTMQPNGTYPGWNPQGTIGFAARPGTEKVQIDASNGHVNLLTNGQDGLLHSTLLETIDTTLYTVVTITYIGLPDIPSSQSTYFRVYQEDSNNKIIASTDKSLTITSTDQAPFANTNYVSISQSNPANTAGIVSKIDLVQLQSYGSPVDLKVPLAIPFPTCASPSCPTGFIGLFTGLAYLMGLGNTQFGAINLFLITMIGTAGLAIVWTKRVYVTLIAGILDISMFIYAGLLPTWILFLMLLCTAFLTLLLFRALIGFGGGGDSPGGDSSEGGTSGGIE